MGASKERLRETNQEKHNWVTYSALCPNSEMKSPFSKHVFKHRPQTSICYCGLFTVQEE